MVLWNPFYLLLDLGSCIVGKGYKADTADDVSEGDGCEVVDPSAEGNGLAGRIQESKGQLGHVGNGVLIAAGNEGEKAPEDHDQLCAFRFTFKTAPYSQADQDVAEDAADDELEEWSGHLGGSGGRQEGLGLFGVKARKMEEESQQCGTGEVSEPADDKKLHRFGKGDLLFGQAGRHDQGITGKKLCACDDNQTQCDAEGTAHDDLGCRGSLEESADHIDQDVAESDIGSGEHGMNKVSAWTFLQEADFVFGGV